MDRIKEGTSASPVGCRQQHHRRGCMCAGKGRMNDFPENSGREHNTVRYKGTKGSLWNAMSSCLGKWVKTKLKI